MARPPSLFWAALVWAGASLVHAPITAAQPLDDPFYRWDLERYRISRAANLPSGAMLPLPDPAFGARRPIVRNSSLRVDAAKADTPVLDEEADGIRIRDGTRGRYQVEGMIPLGRSIRIALGGRFVLGDGRRSGGRWLEQSLCWQGERTEIRIGLTRGFWGDGSEGSLLLGRSAPPLAMVRVRSVRPWRIPGLGERGRLQGSFFLGYLDDRERTIPFPLLMGNRIEWEPVSWARFSGSRMILMGGAGRTEKFRPTDLWDIVWGRNETPPAPRTYRDADQLVSLGGELRLPAPVGGWSGFEGGRLFLEYGGEDSFHRFVPTSAAHHLGIALAFRGWLLLGESVENVDDANPWYTHGTYGPNAYSYRGYPMGHPMGADGRSLHMRLWTPRWGTTRIQGWWRRRGYDPMDRGVVSGEQRFGISTQRQPGGMIVETSFEGARRIPDIGCPDPPLRWRSSLLISWGVPAAPAR